MDSLSETAKQHLAWPDQDLGAFEKLHQTLADMSGSTVDRGIGVASADFWVTIDGVEYFVTVRRSNNQIAKDRPGMN
jgi:hypothetical protein